MAAAAASQRRVISSLGRMGVLLLVDSTAARVHIKSVTIGVSAVLYATNRAVACFLGAKPAAVRASRRLEVSCSFQTGILIRLASVVTRETLPHGLSFARECVSMAWRRAAGASKTSMLVASAMEGVVGSNAWSAAMLSN